MTGEKKIDDVIRKVNDFPKKGILFYDITGLLTSPDVFRYCIKKMTDIYKDRKITRIATIEARGFLFASPLALELGLPIALVRKKNKLPGETLKKTYSLEYGEDSVEIHKSDIKRGDNILIVDDLIATGGTISAVCSLIESVGAKADEIFAVIGLPFLNYEKNLLGKNITTFVNYESEHI